MITIYSAQNNDYQRWQCELLEYSFRKANMPGTLEPIIHEDTYPYAGLNKVEDLSRWAAKDPKSTETVLVVDPDFVFAWPIELIATSNHAFGFPLSYMEIKGKESLLRKYCKRPELFAPVGVPLFISRCDLARIGECWWDKTQEIMADEYWNKELGWVVDMFAYCFVAAELGISHKTPKTCTFPGDALDAPMIHYCYDTPEVDGYQWSKSTYRPWDSVLQTQNCPRASQELLQCITDCRQAHKELP